MINQFYTVTNEADQKLATTFEKDLVLWQSQVKYSYPSVQGQPRLGVFSTLLANMDVQLFNDSKLQENYPQGFYTENRVFVPAQLFNKLIESEPPASSEANVNLSGKLFLEYLLPLVEHKFNHKFSPEDREKVMNNIFGTKYNFHNHPISPEVLSSNPVFVSNQELFKTMPSIGSSQPNTDFIINTLFKSQELHNPEHPFNQLANQVVEIKNNISLSQLTPVQFKEEYLNYSRNSQMEQVFDTLHNIGHQIVQNNPIENVHLAAQEQWIPFVVSMEPVHFVYAVRDFKEQLAEKFLPKTDGAVMGRPYSNLLENVAHAINNEIGIQEKNDPERLQNKRNLLISSITDFDSLNITSRPRI